MEFTARVQTQHRISIPVAVRDEYDIDEGDFIKLEIIEHVSDNS